MSLVFAPSIAATPILIIDDVWSSLAFLVGALNLLGFRNVDRVASGAGALSLAGTKRYRLAVSELHLADASGLETLKRLKLLNATSGLQVIICTSKRDIAHVTAAKAVGVGAYLIKPLAIRTLQQRIEMLLGASLDTIEPETTEPLAALMMID
jgi:DNA-binding response OmpR family regulator